MAPSHAARGRAATAADMRLYQCMQEQCAKPAWTQHAQCVRLRKEQNSVSLAPAYSFSVSPLFGCHFINRFSMRVTAASSSSAKAVSTTMPAITVLMSKLPSACRIR